MAYMMDFFAASTEAKVLSAIKAGTVQYPAYVFIRSTDGKTGRLGFVDQNNVFKYIVGEECKQQVISVVEFPEVGEDNVLYIKDGVVYAWTGSEFKAQYKDHTAELEALDTRVASVETKVSFIETQVSTLEEKASVLEDKVSALESKDEALEAKDVELAAKDAELEAKIAELVEKDKELVSKDDEFETKLAELEGKDSELDAKDAELAGQIEALDKKIDALEIPQECLCEPIKYEVTGLPVGTLVDKREDEIRIMCPQGTEFVKQSVGSTGDPNCYYFTLRTYVPNEAVVGYKEHVGADADKEILTDLKTDEYGRKYQSTWLALARCDANGVWTYYGKNSTKDHYIGWDYQIDWFNADGVMIASDSVRINLSNEDCHFTIEPFYVHGAQADLTAELEALKAQVKTLEENSMTFIELE